VVISNILYEGVIWDFISGIIGKKRLLFV